MDAGPDLDSQLADAVADREGATHGARGTVERREESVTRGVDLHTAVTRELGTHDAVVSLDEPPPGRVAQLRRLRGPVHDVGEEDGREEAIGVGDGTRPREELLRRGGHRILIRVIGHVVRCGQLDQARVRDLRRDPAALLDLRVSVPDGMEHERRDADGRKHGTDVDIGIHATERDRRARTHAQPRPARVSGTDRRVAGHARRDRGEVHLAAAPSRRETVEPRLPFHWRGGPRVVRRPDPLGEDAVRDERGRALGMRRREEDGHVAALGHAEHGGAVGVRGIQHGADVVGALLEGGWPLVRHPIRQARPALVEQDEPREGREAFVEACDRWILPAKLHVADPAGREEQVEGTVADDLVRDVQSAALRVARLGHLHATRRPPA